ncbi:endonuclease/exonuclease/phosphatase family protein [Paracoccus sp. MC1862]|uniref:endonuclease/exonuclease/phosphatase family protein n=1 Tax=Paracoccus sp. MC1862 TaxID=2760307 RepID=UPI0016024E31|nr:endonuclease/exonuclease/phosphatase family protein [Paracoccus sp. MC1862]MBB1498865.1 endonuclease/exonuclease/phosphatase family protein [Paracoccus sp. MC1862]QQO45159.1 endonuclease/exonuclease/phosphatase family protein [Paracoccus sp. MC1862]
MRWRRLGRAALAAGLVLLAASYAGRLHPAGDSLAVGRPFLAAVLVLGGLVLRGGAGWLAAALGALALAPILWAMRPLAPLVPQIIVYQKNLLHSVDDPSGIAADILQARADVALLQEVSRTNAGVTIALAGEMPYQVVCPAPTPGTVAILSRWPFAAKPNCATGVGMASVRVLAPEGAVTVVSLHLGWPWPYGQAAQVERVLPQLARLAEPVVLGGDFNAVPWSYIVSRVATATGTEGAGPVRPTFLLGGLPIAIDHVLAPANWSAAAIMRPWFGSDHRGQVVNLNGRL